MSVCTYVCMCVCARVYVCVTYTHIMNKLNVCMYVCMCVCACVYVYITCTYIINKLHTYKSTWLPYIYVNAYRPVRANMYTLHTRTFKFYIHIHENTIRYIHVNMYRPVCAYMYTLHTHTYKYITHTCKYYIHIRECILDTYTWICTDLCVPICVHCTHTHVNITYIYM